MLISVNELPDKGKEGDDTDEEEKGPDEGLRMLQWILDVKDPRDRTPRPGRSISRAEL